VLLATLAALVVAGSILSRSPTSRRAVVYIQPGAVSSERQLRHCIDYCTRHGYDLTTIVPPAGIADAVAAAIDDEGVVVTAFASRSGPNDLRSQALAAGVPVEYVRPPVIRRELAEAVVTVWRNTGRNLDEAARLLGLTTRNLRSALERLGMYPNGGIDSGRNGKAPDSRE
jgi:hypothetical protein